MKIKHIYTTAIIALSIMVTNCGQEKQGATTDNSTPIAVKVGAVQSDDSQPFLSVSGKIQAVNSSELSTRMMGYINKVHVSGSY